MYWKAIVAEFKEASVPEVVAEEGATRYRAFFKVLEANPLAVGCWLSAAWQRGPIISAKGVQLPAKMDHLTPPPQATEIPTPPMSRMSSIVLLHFIHHSHLPAS